MLERHASDVAGPLGSGYPLASMHQRPGGGELQSFLPKVGRNEPDYALKARAAVATTLIAGLELAREGEITLQQDQAFSAIELNAAVL